MGVKSHDETKLPKWAQSVIRDLRREIERRDALKQAYHLLSRDGGWFTIHGHDVGGEPWTLYTLSNRGAHAVCSIGAGDVLLVGRKK